MSNYPGNYPQQGYGGYGVPPNQGRGAYQTMAGGPGGMHGGPGGMPGGPGGMHGGYQQPGGQPGYPGTMGYQAGYPSAPGYPGGGAMRPPPPGADPTLWNWFITVDRDSSGQISTTELKQALINGNWSQFNDETCRLMISMFDQDQSGTINFTEFCNLWTYIQQWKGVFDRYDRDRSGAIEQLELQTALTEMGYRVSPNFVNLIISKFDTRARRSMKLDSFIQACVMLRVLTNAFRLRDSNQNGVINVNYEDFMCMVIENKS